MLDNVFTLHKNGNYTLKADVHIMYTVYVIPSGGEYFPYARAHTRESYYLFTIMCVCRVSRLFSQINE